MSRCGHLGVDTVPTLCHFVPMARHIAPDAAIIRAALAETGSVKAAAERMGVSRRTLHRWIKKAGIEVERALVVKEAA
jgi:transcriptional regulator of acetoin/glycerol metabolism